MNRIVIGVGNPFRCDDAAGLEVAKLVRSVPAHQSSLGGFELMDLWQGADEVIIVDAIHSNSVPGSIRHYDASAAPLPSGTFASSHTIGVAETIEMARQLGRMPPKVSVVGIEVETVTTGTTISPSVAAAIELVAESINDA